MSKIYKAQDVANYVIEYSNNNEYKLSNLRLQKLMYFIDGFSFKKRNIPAVEEDFEAWNYGPVIPSLYREYSHNGSNQILKDQVKKSVNTDVIYESGKFIFKFEETQEISEELQDIVESVCDSFKNIGDFKIVDLTHVQDPWKNNFTPYERHTIIPKEEIKNFFVEKLDV